MLYTMKNIIGGGDAWAPNADGSTQIKTLALGNTTVVFTDVPYNANYGYVFWVDNDTAADPTVAPPKYTGQLTKSTPTADGKTNITVTLASAVVAAQVGTTCRLRIVR